MAITFFQEKKRQRYLILALALVIFVILLIVWKGFSKPGEEPTTVLPGFAPSPVEIDWSVLQSPQLTELQALATTTPFEGETGRENPFLPY